MTMTIGRRRALEILGAAGAILVAPVVVGAEEALE
jgi:hypothetical protein